MPSNEPDIAVAIPCLNEESTIGKVIDDFRRVLPGARVIVFDNDSTDASAAIAREHDATVLLEPRRGKGYVVESILRRVDADVCVMVDGDDTYCADDARRLIEPILADRADMVVGARVAEGGKAYRPLHRTGNRLVCRLVNWVSGVRLRDVMSGYRAFGRRVARGLPVASSGFEIETEMTVQALYYRMKVIEIETPYRPRPAGSESKLRTVRDGGRVLWKVFNLFRAFKPLTFFGTAALVWFVLGLLAGIAPVRDYLTHPQGYVSHVPLAILATGLMILSAGCLFLGIILHAVNWRMIEMHNVLTRGEGDRKRDTKPTRQG